MQIHRRLARLGQRSGSWLCLGLILLSACQKSPTDTDGPPVVMVDSVTVARADSMVDHTFRSCLNLAAEISADSAARACLAAFAGRDDISEVKLSSGGRATIVHLRSGITYLLDFATRPDRAPLLEIGESPATSLAPEGSATDHFHNHRATFISPYGWREDPNDIEQLKQVFGARGWVLDTSVNLQYGAPNVDWDDFLKWDSVSIIYVSSHGSPEAISTGIPGPDQWEQDTATLVRFASVDEPRGQFSYGLTPEFYRGHPTRNEWSLIVFDACQTALNNGFTSVFTDEWKCNFVGFRQEIPWKVVVRKFVTVFGHLLDSTSPASLRAAMSRVTWESSLGMRLAPDADLSCTPAGLAFGSVALDETRELSLVLTNNSGQSENIQTSIAALNSSFRIAESGSIEVPAGQTRTLHVTFAPTSTGTARDTLRITTNAPNLVSPQAVPLSGTGSGSSTMPWVGKWIQVNFLGTDDQGRVEEWGDDDPTGIGFVAWGTETEWMERDDYGEGCSAIYRLTVNNGRYVKVGKSETCGWGSEFIGYRETGRFEFPDADTMIDWYDYPANEPNTIVAFKYRRAPEGRPHMTNPREAGPEKTGRATSRYAGTAVPLSSGWHPWTAVMLRDSGVGGARPLHRN